MGQCCSAPTADRGTGTGTADFDQDSSKHRELTRHFKVLKRLGTGSYGAVYLVERLEDGKQYALKQTSLTDLEEPLRWVAVNEIRILASLEPHPHVVNCFEGFLDGQWLCIVMELMGNGELADIIRRHAEKDTYIPEADIWSYFIQIALGLKFLHAHGILHRDLKPQNILINSGGQLKIADMGISHVVKSPTGTAKIRIGTPHYMAPEVWRKDPYSFPADIWALGCILHEMCTRSSLFIAPTEREVESRVIAGVVPPIPRRYSMELRELITRMLEYSAPDRPTIDDILASKAVQSRLHLLPEESAGTLACTVKLDFERAASSVLDPIEIPADLKLLNLRLPAARYSMGQGLVTVLAAESEVYRNFAMGPAELPTFTMPRPKTPPPAGTAAGSSGGSRPGGLGAGGRVDTAYGTTNGNASSGSSSNGSCDLGAAGVVQGPRGPSFLPPLPSAVEDEGEYLGNPEATSDNWQGQCNNVIPQKPY